MQTNMQTSVHSGTIHHYIVIGLAGYAGVGKTATAAHLSDLAEANGVQALITSFADGVKKAAREVFGWSGEKDAKGRKLLQMIGTDVGRTWNPDIWVDQWRQKAQKFLQIQDSQSVKEVYPYRLLLVDDVRFQNEVDAIRDMGGVVVRLNRPAPMAPSDQHASEQADKLAVDADVPNEEGHLLLTGIRVLLAAMVAGRANERRGPKLPGFQPIILEATAHQGEQAVYDEFNRASYEAAMAPAIAKQREDIVAAFVAKYGCELDQVVQIVRNMPDGSVQWSVERKREARQ